LLGTLIVEVGQIGHFKRLLAVLNLFKKNIQQIAGFVLPFG